MALYEIYFESYHNVERVDLVETLDEVKQFVDEQIEVAREYCEYDDCFGKCIYKHEVEPRPDNGWFYMGGSVFKIPDCLEIDKVIPLVAFCHGNGEALYCYKRYPYQILINSDIYDFDNELKYLNIKEYSKVLKYYAKRDDIDKFKSVLQKYKYYIIDNRPKLNDKYNEILRKEFEFTDDISKTWL